MTERPMLPPDQYVASLARKRMGAAALFRDQEGRVLIVNPAGRGPASSRHPTARR
ncbi:MAG: hypothetical protein J2P25_03390 [Nocardiopsaceae bacterium]|nr:hypothetical protein [Nocardiopsaceae bacterium]